MEGEEEYLETDIQKICLDNLKNLGMEAEAVESGRLDIEKPPYYSSFFAGGIFRMVDNIGTIKVKNQNFEYIHIVRLG
ncbi:MAG: hypothetical protein ACE5KA_04705 [Nitrososphaerales archaeon]